MVQCKDPEYNSSVLWIKQCFPKDPWTRHLRRGRTLLFTGVTGTPASNPICLRAQILRVVRILGYRLPSPLYATQTLHVCHICRSVGVVLGVNGAAYGIHGVSGHFPSPKPAEMKQPSRERKNYFFTNELGNERLTLPETIMEVGSGLL